MCFLNLSSLFSLCPSCVGQQALQHSCSLARHRSPCFMQLISQLKDLLIVSHFQMAVDEWKGEATISPTYRRSAMYRTHGSVSHISDSWKGLCLGSALKWPNVSSPSPSGISPVKYFKDNGHLVIHSENTYFAEAAEKGCKRSFMSYSEKK